MTVTEHLQTLKQDCDASILQINDIKPQIQSTTRIWERKPSQLSSKADFDPFNDIKPQIWGDPGAAHRE
jgi:hypothetical protein